MTGRMDFKCEICGSAEDVRRYRCPAENELHRLCYTCRRLFRLLAVMRFSDVIGSSLGDSTRDRLVEFSKHRLQSISKCLISMDVDRKDLIDALSRQPHDFQDPYQYPVNA